MVKISLILATLGPVNKLERFFVALGRSTFDDIEVIIADQNDDDRVINIVRPYININNIKILKTAKGLSRARNRAVKDAIGEILAFPDDDCWYPKYMLSKVLDNFKKNECDIFTFKACDDSMKNIAPFDTGEGYCDKISIFKRVCSISLFMKKHVYDLLGGFDEELGLGSGTPWSSGEDYELPIRAIEQGYKVYYNSDVYAHHEVQEIISSAAVARRGISYSPAIGRIWKMYSYPLSYVLYMLIRPIGGALINFFRLDFTKSIFYICVLLGRLKGYLFSNHREL